jgi:hypothetical protein
VWAIGGGIQYAQKNVADLVFYAHAHVEKFTKSLALLRIPQVPKEAKYIFIQYHMDNSDLDEGMFDQSGFAMYVPLTA